MPHITEIDPNFKVDTQFDYKDAVFYDVKKNSWCLFGLQFDTIFRRMPQEVAENVNEGVLALHTNTSGGRLRFTTDSPYILLSAEMPDQVVFPHMPQTGAAGFDLLVNGCFAKTFIPPLEWNGMVQGSHKFLGEQEREIQIHFPLYNNVHRLHIGLKKGCSFKPASPLPISKKVVFYGSSITQGGCVSRPGLAYPAQVANNLGCDLINLGFSGSAKGEPAMAEYLAALHPDVLVLDYDHNAPSLPHLEQTHEAFYKIFRAKRKDTPIILLSAPNLRINPQMWMPRREVIRTTYEHARAAGDRNVYFIDGESLWGGADWDLCTMDGCHPGDLGHFRMAQQVEPVLKKIFEELA